MDGREGKAKVSGTVSLGAGAGPNKGLELTAFSSSSGLAFGINFCARFPLRVE